MDFIENDRLIKQFEVLISENKLSHAYIIEGDFGSGKKTLARIIACHLFCGHKPPCFECALCKRILDGGHQDVIELHHPDMSTPIKIDEIRELLSEVPKKSVEGNYKVFIIENAGKLNVPSQNALLQIIEEPPKNTVFFLLATNRNRLLPTILSRTVTVKTAKVSPDSMKALLTKKYPDKAELIDEAIRLSYGSVGKAVQILESDGKAEAITTARKYFAKLSSKADLVSLSEVINPKASPDRETFFEVMGYIYIGLRDAIVNEEAGPMFLLEGEGEKISSLIPKKNLVKASDTVLKIIRDTAKINLQSAALSLNTALASDFTNI